MSAEPAPRDVFDQIVARVSQTDPSGSEQSRMVQARELARSQGIADAAWDAAVGEYSHGSLTTVLAPVSGIRAAIIAAGGLAVGYYSARQGNIDSIFMGALAAASTLIAITGARRRTARATEVELASWWVAVAGGIMVGAGEFVANAAWFSGILLPVSVGFARWVRTMFRKRQQVLRDREALSALPRDPASG